MGIIYPADYYRVNVQRSNVNGDKSPLSPDIPSGLDANSISDNHPFLYANLFIQLYFSTAWLFNEGRKKIVLICNGTKYYFLHQT